MTKIVINTCYGGFGLSKEATDFINLEEDQYEMFIRRDDPKLVRAVEALGDKANGTYAQLEIVEIPDDVKHWVICEYDGKEWVAEAHRTWG